jgi:hypothetical protein
MGMRDLKQMFYGTLAVAVLVCFGTTAQAQEICDDATHPIAPDSTVDCSLLVPENAGCTLAGVTVTGNIIVQSHAYLIDRPDGPTPSSVGGNVIATDALCVSLTVSSVGGNVIATGTNSGCFNTDNLLCTPRVGGNVEILGSTSHSLPWCFEGDSSCGCSSARMTVGGNFEFENNATPGTITGDIIHGNLLFERNTDGGTVTGDHISGNLIVDGNHNSALDVSTDSVGGNLQFDVNHTSANTVSTNHAGGNIQCFSNTPAPTGSGNTAGGVKSGQCKSL